MRDNQATYAARSAFVNSLGTVAPDVLAPLVNPSFMGGPLWPDLRQAWIVIQRNNSVAIMSDGLSDPFSDTDEMNCGFELEVIAETSDPLPSRLEQSWLFDLVYGVSQQCANHGGVAEIVTELGILSLELPVGDSLQSIANDNGRVGVLLGLPADDVPRHFDLPGGTALALTATLLFPSELEYVVANGGEGRTTLAELFEKSGLYHRSSLSRSPFV
jgi:hypothetical protein